MSNNEDRSSCKATELRQGDVFGLHVYGEVREASPVGDGKRIKVKLVLEGTRSASGAVASPGTAALEFLDTGYVIEFICRPNRVFHLMEWDDDDDDDGGDGEPLPDGDGGEHRKELT
jgi:hypothetical protein